MGTLIVIENKKQRILPTGQSRGIYVTVDTFVKKAEWNYHDSVPKNLESALNKYWPDNFVPKPILYDLIYGCGTANLPTVLDGHSAVQVSLIYIK